jgi:aerobic carbon-monoxide dehydrogenase large subunit
VLDRGGHIVSWEDDYLVDLGVHNLWMVGVVGNTAMHLLGAYRIPNVRVTGTGVFSNKTPTAQYRGAGRPEACFVLERSLDRAAVELGIHPVKLRSVNILGAGDLPYPQGVPYRDGVEITYDGKDYARVLDEALGLIPEATVAQLRNSAAPHERVGFGVSVYMEATARGPAEPETARVRLLLDGTVEVATGTGPSGQAHKTVFAQVAADALHVPYDRVRVITGDTDTVSQGLGSFASRSAVIAGSAVRIAAQELGALAAETVNRGLGEEAVLADDGLRVGPGGRLLTWPEVAALAGEELSASYSFAPTTVTWTMGVHTVVVKVDVETGHVQVLRYAVAHETGPSLNPRVVDGQIRGGVAQGIGSALLEHVDHDASGQPLSATLAEYMVPEATDVPHIALAHLEVPSELNPLGIRGVGESGIIAGSAAIAGALDDALEEYGVRVDRTPMTPEYLLTQIEGGRV